MTFAVETLALEKSFGDRVAVRAVDLGIRPGTFYALVGGNGSGKSTILKLLAGALQPSAGQVVIFGDPLHPNAAATRAAIGFLSQPPAFFEELTAREQLIFSGQLYGLPLNVISERADHTLGSSG